MCKWCDLKPENVDRGEYSNGCPKIKVLKDGSQEFALFINRWIANDEPGNRYLILDLATTINGDCYSVKETKVKIKYCPFCGEKL